LIARRSGFIGVEEGGSTASRNDERVERHYGVTIPDGQGEVVLGHLWTVVVMAEDAALLTSVHPLPDVSEISVVPSPFVGVALPTERLEIGVVV
jgi:hypothetical protein